MKATESFLPWDTLDVRLEQLQLLLKAQDAGGVRAFLAELIPEYDAGKLTDWVSAKRSATVEQDKDVPMLTLPNGIASVVGHVTGEVTT